MKTLARGGALFLLAGLSGGAAAPHPLASAGGGYWEVEGKPGTAPARMCLGNTRTLVHFEHRGQACPMTVVSQSGGSAVIQYNCPRGGFGRSEVTMVTPRSFRIATQGISGGLPFNYVIQARRLGGCRPNH